MKRGSPCVSCQNGVETKSSSKSVSNTSSNINSNKGNGHQISNPPSTTTPNRPRNLLITDATQPFRFSFARCGVLTTLTIQQTPDETSWPGGALWDLGVLLGQVLVGLTPNCTTKTSIAKSNQRPIPKQQPAVSKAVKKKTNTCLPSPSSSLTAAASNTLPSRLVQVLSEWRWNETCVLELGCGVGLTGLVAAALGAKLVLLTDLDVVIEQVTTTNVQANANGTKPTEHRLPSTLFADTCACHRTVKSTGCHVIAMPLCWGNSQDEAKVRQVLECFSEQPQIAKLKSKLRSNHPLLRNLQNESTNCFHHNSVCPNLILIGDVAYQHKPGAPSHFEALQSTLFKFVDDNTVVLFGTRLRMPASADLLDLFLEKLEEVVVPPIGADEIDPIFSNQKHNMSIHVMKRRKQLPEGIHAGLCA